MKGREVPGHGPRVVKSGSLRELCGHGPESRTASAPAGWVSLEPCDSFLRQGTDKSASPRGVHDAATCHSISAFLELYAQLTVPIGWLNSGNAEKYKPLETPFSLWPTS